MAAKRNTAKGASRAGPAPTIPAVSYVRVSSDEQAEKYGPDVQRAAIADYARRSGLELVGEFSDLGVSGTVPLEERPGLSAALEAVEEGRAEVLVCSTFSRLARDTLQALLIERAFRAADAKILFSEGVNGDSDAEQTMRTMMHEFAGLERRQLLRRLREAREAKAAQGGFSVGREPYGYRPEAGKLVPDIAPPPPKQPKPEKGEKRPPPPPRIMANDRAGKVVRFIFEEIARGISPGMVARALNGAGVPTPKGGTTWRDTTVRVIVRNDAYISPGNAVHEPLVGRRMFNTAQRELDKRTRA